MTLPISQKIEELARALLPQKLYVVGGFVRNFLIDKTVSVDVDLCAPISVKDLQTQVEKLGFRICAQYPRTQTLVFEVNGVKYEYTAFRSETYNRGGNHQPQTVSFTCDIVEDALRRDFKCNAVYYDIVNKAIVDPLGGVLDIQNKVLDTVKSSKEVFSHDGLRLMRLARFCGELGFTPTKQVLESALLYADNVKEIAPERIYKELKYILSADSKYPFSPKKGHYLALKILDETRVLDRILPELTAGRTLPQRSDFHKYDVLEHSLRSVLYADKSVRLCALLHDIGKPFAMQKDGKYHLHYSYGESIAIDVLNRLRAEKSVIDEVAFMVKNHMLDIKSDMRDSKIKLFIVKNLKYYEKLLKVKQADYSACKDDLSVCPTVEKWQKLYLEMKKNGVPFSIKDLHISAKELIESGFLGVEVGKTLKFLLEICVLNPEFNQKQKLLQLALQNKNKG